MEVQAGKPGDTVGVETQGLTFQRLLVWTKEPKARMKLLAALVEACHGQRGGALASVIHSFVLQGNATLKTVVLKILVQVCRPLYEMLMLWTFEGELRDPYGEFFIGVSLSVDAGSLWNDKYYERSVMVPNFFTQEQGHQVATTGKSICFLREICLDKSPIPGLNQIRRTAEERSGILKMIQQVILPHYLNVMFHLESLLSLDWESIEEAYSTASQYLLQVLLDRYHIKLHLCALRQYLLLGQGDFINHLMKLVA
jgi:gamma-tubulin complex component 3